MKRVIWIVVLIFSSITSLWAQTDAKAKAILDAVSAKYGSYNVIKTDFTYTINNPSANMKETMSGTLYVHSKLNKYKVMLNDQELISDGKNQWTFLKADKEVQLSDVDNRPNALNPATIYSIYKKGFKYLYTGDVKNNGRVYQMIDLSPIDTKNSFFKIRLSIDKQTKQIKNALIFDKNGSRYTYAVKSLTPNVKVSESFFVFDSKKYPGVEVVDLR